MNATAQKTNNAAFRPGTSARAQAPWTAAALLPLFASSLAAVLGGWQSITFETARPILPRPGKFVSNGETNFAITSPGLAAGLRSQSGSRAAAVQGLRQRMHSVRL